MNDRQKAMLSAYTEATNRLRNSYIHEFHAYLEQVYQERGMDVRKRLRGSRLLEKKLADARALIAEASKVTDTE
jgi:hypothetical protein